MDDSTDLHALIVELRCEIAALRQENAELRRRLNLNSSTSSKPPSSDGLKKKPRAQNPRNKSLRGKSGKKSGGQKGHKGDTLRQSDAPDKIEQHKVCACSHCQSQLDASNVIGQEMRQVFDIPEPKLEVTEHRADISKCPACGKTTKAAFPTGVNAPAQYGARIKSAAVYFNVQQLIPEDRSAQIMTDLFGAPRLCPASITAWADKKAKDFEPVVEAIMVGGAVKKKASSNGTMPAISMKLDFASAAKRSGCTRFQVPPSPATLRPKNAATSRPFCVTARVA